MSELVREVLVLVKEEDKWVVNRQVQVLTENVEDIEAVVDDYAL